MLREKIQNYQVFRAAFERTQALGERVVFSQLKLIRETLHELDNLPKDGGNTTATANVNGASKDTEQRSPYETLTEAQNIIFSALLVDGLWDEDKRVAMTQAILHEHTDESTALMMLSAIMLSCLTIYDSYKHKLLFEVFLKSDNERIQARAIVGLVFAMNRDAHSPASKAQWEWFGQLMDNEDNAKMLLEVQKCIFSSANAEKDSKLADNHISGFLKEAASEKFGLGEELEESNGIIMRLGPERSSELIHGISSLVKKIETMERQGSDIYYNGFAKAKHFGFFHLLANWFRPFDIMHPTLNSLATASNGDQHLFNIFCKGMSLCDNDKYSFFLMMQQKLGGNTFALPQMPEGMDIMGMETIVQPTLAESIKEYMQDLFRFFQLSPMNTAFVNPFQKADCRPFCFMALEDIDGDCADDVRTALVKSLLANKDYTHMGQVLQQIHLSDDRELAPFFAIYYIKGTHEYEKAVATLNSFRAIMPDIPDLDDLYGYALFMLQRYDEAAAYLRQTVAAHEKSMLPKLRLAYCYIETRQLDEAKRLLYEMEYKTPGRIEVLRMLAWALLLAGDLDKAWAMTEYKVVPLLAQPESKSRPEDYYNAALCYLCHGEEQKALDYLRRFQEHAPETDLYQKLVADKQVWTQYGIDMQHLGFVISLL